MQVIDMKFETYKFHPWIAAGIREMGYTETTPIQEQALPFVLEGKDLLGQAQTGTGKTAAFVLPILQRLLDRPHGPVRALIIAPTRELAEQIHVAICDLGRHVKVRSVTVYGGVGMEPQIKNLRNGADIVVACPGRLLDHIERRNVNLSQVEVLVLDEADRMLDMGFLPDIRRILNCVPKRRQTLLFSATLPNDIRRLASDFMRDPVTVQIGTGAPVDTVSHYLYPVPQHLKAALLIALLHRTDARSVLVFTRTKHRAKRIAKQLEDAGFKSTSLQGNLSQSKRQAAMDGFRRGAYQILVATDIAARGIDVSTISHVINFDIPDSADAYTHRIGRTGRVDKTGDAFTLMTVEDEGMVRSIEALLGAKIERRILEDFDYHRAAPEWFGDSSGQRRQSGNRNRRGMPGGARHSFQGRRPGRR